MILVVQYAPTKKEKNKSNQVIPLQHTMFIIQFPLLFRAFNQDDLCERSLKYVPTFLSLFTSRLRNEAVSRKNQLMNLTFTGWTQVQRYEYITADLETSILELKTDSSLGSDEKVKVEFSTDSGVRVGGVILHFADPPQYKIRNCNFGTDFSTTLPTEVNKVWKISLTRTSYIRLVIHCNEEEVVNVTLSDTTCNTEISEWSDTWNKDIKQIRFEEDDTASDYYRIKGRGSYQMLN